MPPVLLDLWNAVTGYDLPPEACLVNFYGEGARTIYRQGIAMRIDESLRQCLEQESRRIGDSHFRYPVDLQVAEFQQHRRHRDQTLAVFSETILVVV